jgi:hypothetical protein
MRLWQTWLLHPAQSGRLSEGGKISCLLCFCILRTQTINRQMNMDYSICNTLKYCTAGLIAALIIYDIVCQWWINFLRRVESLCHLSLPEGMKLLTAVGSFHLSSHIPQCFTLYSLHFAHGSGYLDGEIGWNLYVVLFASWETWLTC